MYCVYQSYIKNIKLVCGVCADIARINGYFTLFLLLNLPNLSYAIIILNIL